MSADKKKSLLSCFDSSINSLSYLVMNLENYDGAFDATAKEAKEVIGDLVCARFQIERKLN